MGEKIKLTQRWCLVEDRSRVVPENDPEARWLHWREGDEVDLEEAIELGAVKKKAPPHRKRAAKKMQPAPANKQAKPPENKEGW